MKRILITGALGQLGTELTVQLREIYGNDAVMASDIRKLPDGSAGDGPYRILDVTDGQALYEAAHSHQADTIIHLAALLSARAEASPMAAWNLNMGGLMQVLEVARVLNLRLFVPSSIAVFGRTTPKRSTPQDTLQRPSTMYGINKVAGELLCDYYHYKYGLDTRGLRFPGLISYMTPPGGGTTDYAVDMYRAAVSAGSYTSYIQAGTFLDMLYMPDAVQSIVTLMEAPSAGLIHRNAYNVTGMSVDPESLAASIRKRIPSFQLDYKVDPVRQSIAEDWPDSIDSSEACRQWGFRPRFNLEHMTEDMLEKLTG